MESLQWHKQTKRRKMGLTVVRYWWEPNCRNRRRHGGLWRYLFRGSPRWRSLLESRTMKYPHLLDWTLEEVIKRNVTCFMPTHKSKPSCFCSIHQPTLVWWLIAHGWFHPTSFFNARCSVSTRFSGHLASPLSFLRPKTKSSAPRWYLVPIFHFIFVFGSHNFETDMTGIQYTNSAFMNWSILFLWHTEIWI